ncbi:MAG TPA: M48 family metallopeptidase [Stellaceae bacterium]|nr:M48 family metallopeptidase [Stellaceae bacterium]
MVAQHDREASAKPARAGTKSATLLAQAEQRAAALELGAPVAIRINPRARRLLLRIDAAARQVELVLPRGVAAERGLTFLVAQRGWIAARLAALPEPVPFAEGAVVPILGVPHVIRREAETAASPVAIAGGEIRVKGDPRHLPRRVRDHLARLAAGELAHRARACALRIDRPIVRIAVRDTKSRWGSCSAAGSLSFSWRLVMAPEPVIDYVVAHEVAHLVEMNHGPRFWRLVRTLVGDTAAPRAWLKRNRNRLFSYG